MLLHLHHKLVEEELEDLPKLKTETRFVQFAIGQDMKLRITLNSLFILIYEEIDHVGKRKWLGKEEDNVE